MNSRAPVAGLMAQLSWSVAPRIAARVRKGRLVITEVLALPPHPGKHTEAPRAGPPFYEPDAR